MKNNYNYDLVVVGSGPGGFAAAAAGARKGLKTAMIEKNGFVGGTMQVGLNIHGFEDMNGNRVIGGIPWELIQKCIEKNGALPPVPLKGAHMFSTTPVDLEVLQSTALEILLDSKVDIYLHTYALRPIVEDKKIKKLICWNKSGENIFNSKYYIDATGDADIAYRANVDTEKGRGQDNLMQPMSLLVTFSSVDIDGLVDNLGLGYGKAKKPGCEKESYTWFALNFKKWKEQLDNIDIKIGTSGVFWGNSIREGIANLNAVKILEKDGTDVHDITNAEIRTRIAATKFAEFLKNEIPYFEKSNLVRTAPFIGVRETRRIKGKYILKEDEAIRGDIPEDTIALCGYPIDIHSPNDGIAEFSGLKTGRFGIPYRSLQTKEIDNLLVSGRAISASHGAAAATRVMGTCLAIGEACGYAAFLSKEKNTYFDNIDGRKLRNFLENNNSIKV